MTPAELEVKVDTLQTALDEEQAQVTADRELKLATIKTLTEENAALKAIIDAGGADPEALQRIADKIDAAIADIQTTVEPE